MTYGATFLKGNYELPSAPEPVRLSRERWEMLASHRTIDPVFSVRPETDRIVLHKPCDADGVIFLPAEYVPEQVAQ